MGLISWLFGKSKKDIIPACTQKPDDFSVKEPEEPRDKENFIENDNPEQESIDYDEIKTAILIDYVKNQEPNLRLPYYLIQLLGGREKDLLNKALENGYVRFAFPQEAIKKLLVPDLKKLLKENGLPVSGRKAVLISRIVDSIPEEKYRNKVPNIYVLTESGNNLVSENYIYIQNRYSLDVQFCKKVSRIKNRLNCGTSEDDYIKVFSEIYKSDIQKAMASKNWGDLSIAYYDFSILLSDVSKDGYDLEKSLLYNLYSICIDLSGMENRNSVQDKTLVMIYPAMLNQFNSLGMNISDKKILFEIDSAVSEILDILPFSYFSKNSMRTILVDLLNGDLEDTNIYEIEKYKKLWRKPNPHDTQYEYFEYARSSENW